MNKDMIRMKTDFFLREKVFCHIKLKSKVFLNAHIISKITDDVYKINDRILGEKFLFLEEVYEITEFEVNKNE